MENHHAWEDSFTWENFGQAWVIDHTVPVSWFDMMDAEQQRDAFHWSNTKPMARKANEVKGAHWPG